MKVLHLTLLLVLGLAATVHAQDVDDDMYYVPSKKKAVKTPKKFNTYILTHESVMNYTDSDADTDADYHTGQVRDTDEYNRRGNLVKDGQVVAKLVNDTLFVYSNDSTGQQVLSYGNEYAPGDKYYQDDNYYEDDYTYTSRLGRYHSVHFVDPWYWDYTYGWYDPWYDPWYGWYAPYYRHGYYSWYNWGWSWNYGPGWGYGWTYPVYHHHYHHPIYSGGGSVVHRPVNNAVRKV